MKLTVIALLIAILATGCVGKFRRVRDARHARVELVGMSKKDLYLCAGVPARAERVDDLEFLTYTSGGDSTSIGVGTATSSTTGVGVVSTHRRYCEITFVLSNEIVRRINYQGRTGGLATRGEQCAFVVENCLSR